MFSWNIPTLKKDEPDREAWRGEDGLRRRDKPDKNTLMQLPHGSLSMTFEKSRLIKIKPKTLTLPGSLWKGHSENLLNTEKTNYRKSDTEKVKSRGKGPLGCDKMEQEKQFGHWKTDYSEWSVKYVLYTSQ